MSELDYDLTIRRIQENSTIRSVCILAGGCAHCGEIVPFPAAFGHECAANPRYKVGSTIAGAAPPPAADGVSQTVGQGKGGTQRMMYLASWRPTFQHAKEWWWMLPICVRTFSAYAHSEIVFTQPGDEDLHNALCWSATYGQGVRPTRRNVLDGSWDLQTLSVSRLQEAYAHKICDEIVGSEYGWTDILQFLLPHVKNNIDTYDCSCTGGVMLARIGYLSVYERDCWKIAPGELARLVREREARKIGLAA